jgi:hypothetical protein
VIAEKGKPFSSVRFKGPGHNHPLMEYRQMRDEPKSSGFDVGEFD